MSNDIGYGASAIRAGEVKYQQKLVDLMRQAATKKPANDAAPAEAKASAKPADANVGRSVDIKA
jgi:hypothetical protein